MSPVHWASQPGFVSRSEHRSNRRQDVSEYGADQKLGIVPGLDGDTKTTVLLKARVCGRGPPTAVRAPTRECKGPTWERVSSRDRKWAPGREEGFAPSWGECLWVLTPATEQTRPGVLSGAQERPVPCPRGLPRGGSAGRGPGGHAAWPGPRRSRGDTCRCGQTSSGCCPLHSPAPGAGAQALRRPSPHAGAPTATDTESPPGTRGVASSQT